MIPLYIKKYCCYTRDIQNYRFMQSKIFYASYENTADLINAKNDLNITRQSVYLYEREACRINLVKKEQELWKIIKKLEITVSGIYHYDEVRQDRAFSPITSVKFFNLKDFNPCCLGFPSSKFRSW